MCAWQEDKLPLFAVVGMVRITEGRCSAWTKGTHHGITYSIIYTNTLRRRAAENLPSTPEPVVVMVVTTRFGGAW